MPGSTRSRETVATLSLAPITSMGGRSRVSSVLSDSIVDAHVCRHMYQDIPQWALTCVVICTKISHNGRSCVSSALSDSVIGVRGKQC